MKKITLFLVVFCLASNVVAYDFNVGGIYYKITSSDEPCTAAVTYRNTNYNSYTGTAVVIPESVTYNGKTYSVTTIESNAFYGSSNLQSVTIPNSVVSIENSVFYNCTGLKSLIMGASVKSIGNYAFSVCNNLTSLALPNSVNSIGIYAFSGCSKLANLVLPNFVSSIGAGAFQNCTSLTSLTLPNYITTIEGSTFSNCGGLKSLIIGSFVTSIKGAAFNNCGNLTKIRIACAVPPEISSNTFSGDRGYCKLEVPAGSGSAYDNDPYWSTCPVVSEINRITIQISGNGTITESGMVMPNGALVLVDEGLSKTFTIQPAIGYEVQSVFYNGADVKSQIVNNKYITPAATSAAPFSTLNVTFIQQQVVHHSLTVQVGDGGIVKEINTVLNNNTVLSVNEGESKTFTIQPNTGYVIQSLIYNGTNITSQIVNDEYTTPPITADATISITFKKLQFKLALRSAESGCINLLCEYGLTPSFTFTASDGWKINTIKYNDIDVTNSLVNNELTLPAITADGLVSVSFEEGTSTQNPAMQSGELKIYANESEIVVEGVPTGANISVYTLNGIEISRKKALAGKTLIDIPKGAVYIVKAQQWTAKVIL